VASRSDARAPDRPTARHLGGDRVSSGPPSLVANRPFGAALLHTL